jgi:hypothetical protein
VQNIGAFLNNSKLTVSHEALAKGTLKTYPEHFGKLSINSVEGPCTLTPAPLLSPNSPPFIQLSLLWLDNMSFISYI